MHLYYEVYGVGILSRNAYMCIHMYFECSYSSPVKITYIIIGMTTQSESLFTYYGNRSWELYAHPAHTPVFADEIIPTDYQRLLCANNVECIYDLSQTNSTRFAMETTKFGEVSIINAKIISKFVIKNFLILV